MVAAGAHILLFTTGRGTPLGFPSPTIKISTNSDLARRSRAWIDFDAGPIALRRPATFERARPSAVRAGARRRQRPHADQERTQRLPRDRDLEGRRHAVSALSRSRARRAAAGVRAQLPAELAVTRRSALPERVLQFGEGNFLRAFVDWMLDAMNARGLFGGPRGAGAADRRRAWPSRSTRRTACTRVHPARPASGQHRRVSARSCRSVSRCIESVPGLRRVHRAARRTRTCASSCRTRPRPASRPTRPTRSTRARRTSFPGQADAAPARALPHFGGDPARGLVMLPCELIERNGDALARAVLETARALGAVRRRFVRWRRRGVPVHRHAGRPHRDRLPEGRGGGARRRSSATRTQLLVDRRGVPFVGDRVAAAARRRAAVRARRAWT